jgi:hypothetical protein
VEPLRAAARLPRTAAIGPRMAVTPELGRELRLLPAWPPHKLLLGDGDAAVDDDGLAGDVTGGRADEP